MPIRPRRLRQNPYLRQTLQGVSLSVRDFILPVFLIEGQNQKRAIASLPGVYQMSPDVAIKWLSERATEGFLAYLLFGVIDSSKKDDTGSEALNADNVVCTFLRLACERQLPMLGITDLCFCEYTSHGQCGILSADQSTVKNDETVARLVTQAINHCHAGAGMIAPSGMMDGTVGALRAGLDAAGFDQIPILSYAVKYASAFYGPFREAAQSAPAFGDRKSYQMNPAASIDEAIREATLDVAQGADLVMVKPAGAYLDVIARVRQAVQVPLVAYQVSGEYAMLESASQAGWIDHDRAVLESLWGIKRAGASLIISYYGEILVKLLGK